MTGSSVTARTRERDGPRAEVAFAIADELQGRGRRDDPARPPRRGRRRKTGSRSSRPRCCPTNHRMVEVFRESGFPVETSSAPAIDPRRVSDLVLRRCARALRRRDRDRRRRCGPRVPGAAVRRRDRRLAPPRHGRRRDLPQPARRRIQGRRLPRESRPPRSSSRCARIRRSPTSPGAVDLAVIAVPAPAVGGVARRVRRKGGGRAGGDLGRLRARPAQEGMERQRELVEVCRERRDATGRARTASAS